MLNRFTIKTRLIFVIGFLSLQLVAGGVIGIVSLGNANGAMQSLYDNRLVVLGQLDLAVRLLDANQLDLAKAIDDEPEEASFVLKQIESDIQKLDAVWRAYLTRELRADERKLAEKFAADHKVFVGEGLRPAIDAARSGNRERAKELLQAEMEQNFEPLRKSVDALIKMQLDVARSDFEQSQKMYDMVRIGCSAGIVLGVLLALGIGFWLVRAITRPLEAAVGIAGAIARGDLTQSIAVVSRDETGRLMQALKDMNGSLATIVGQVRAGTETMGTASSQIAAGNEDLSTRTEQQAGALQETASSMEELTSTVRLNAENARQANQLAASASGVADKGGAVVKEVVSTMDSINESSRRIVDIIGVIDGIAFQTNILALNAAVEAARAGEQGRGFAVVAAEVRSLAQRSAAAAREVKELIDESVNKVGVGTALVGRAGATMEEVVDSVKRVSGIIGEISAASEEQTSRIEQVSRAIAQMDESTQQNAALVEQAAAASGALRQQASALADAVGVFRLDDAAAQAVPAPAAAPAPAPVPSHAVARRLPVAAGKEWEAF